MSQSAADILKTLISFDTVSHNSNLPIIEWIEAYLASHSVASQRVYDETGEKANLLATIGPEAIPGIILSGHVDVVPVEGQPWSTDPFEATVIDGKMFGRGSSDMKGFVACVLAAVPGMIAADLTTPLHLCFSYDEEVGCIGVRGAIREIAKWPVPPRACIVGEPTMMQVVTGHKSKRSVRVTVRGKAGHSSLAPDFVNAVEYASRLTVYISDMGREFAANGASDPLYDCTHTTAHVGLMHGGTQLNIVPEHATFDFEFRTIAADDPHALVKKVIAYAQAELIPAMQAIDADTGIEFEDLAGVDGLETPEESEIVTLAKSLAKRNDHAKVAFGTEGGLFQSMADISTVVIGPGSIDRAHKADEYITLEEIAAGSAFLDGLIKRCSA
jgi:acetylornithine deacetylase